MCRTQPTRSRGQLHADRLAPYIRHRLEEQHRATVVFLARHDPECTK
ncbi:hypothetical protein [Streptomyces sp. NPDC007205]